MGGEAGVRARDGIHLAFMRKLDPTRRTPKLVPGGSHQIENAARQRCVRNGWAMYLDMGSSLRGWVLTKAGVAALALAAPPGVDGETKKEG